jgi:hypothetical protein
LNAIREDHAKEREPMDMSEPVSPAVDANALAEALGTLGLLYGDRAALDGAAAGAADEGSAIRAFLRQERAHLLATYDLDALVGLVLDARARNDRAPVSIETYSPA